jgi:hypothetical protein
MQDEIVSRLANRLRAELYGVEARRAQRAASPDSTDHFAGRERIYDGMRKAGLPEE